MTQQVMQIDTGSGLFVIDVELLHSIIRDWAYWKAVTEQSKTEHASNSRWFNPLSWGMPDIVSVNIDWDKVKHSREMYTNALSTEFQHVIHDAANRNYCGPGNASANGPLICVRNTLYQRSQQAHDWKVKWHKQLKDASDETMTHVNNAVDGYGAAVNVAKFIRDGAGDVIMVGATVASGGTATALLAAGSVYKGAAKWQDTRSVAAAFVEASCDMILGVIPGPAKGAKNAEKAVLLFAKGQIQFARDLSTAALDASANHGAVTGSTVIQAALNTTLSTVGGAAIGSKVDALVGTEALTKLFEDKAAPVTLKIAAKLVARGTVDTATSTLSGAAVNAAFAANPHHAGTNGLNPAVGVGEPSLVDLAIQGPYYSTMRRTR